MLKKSLLISMLALASAGSMYAWKPIFVGHRGCYRGVANTVEAYRNAADYYHYDGIECDVRVTKDGHYVILHDNTTGTVCPDANIDAQQSTLAELKALKFQQTRGGVTYTGEICTVEEYLDVCVEKNLFPVIELKWTTGINTNDMSNFPGLMALVEKKGLRSKAVFLTSMLASLQYVKKNYPDVKCQYLLSSDSDAKHKACADYDLNPSFDTSLTEEIATRYRQEGREVAVWTVNSEANYRKFGKMGTYMMTCDYLVPAEMPELEEPTLPEPPPLPIELENSILWTRSKVQGNLPVNYPDKAATGGYSTGQQPAIIDGKFYVNDYGTKSLVVVDKDCEAGTILPYSETELGGSAVHGITTDDADNIIIRNESSFSVSPSKVRIFAKGTTTNPVDVEFSLGEYGAQNNFVFASGNVLSEEGGYLYFLPNKQTVLSLVHIVNGKLDKVITRSVAVQGSTASVILPIENDPDNFIYMVRSAGFYRWNQTDQGVFLYGASPTAPARNSSLGGAYMVIGGHEILAYPSGSNYNGGFGLMDVTAGNKVLDTFDPLGTGGYTNNASTGTFMKPVKIKEDLYHLHTFTMGGGYGVYEIKLKGVESAVESVEDNRAEKLNVMVGEGVITVSAAEALGTVSVYSVTGAEVKRVSTSLDQIEISTESLSKGIYIVNVNGKLPVKVVI